MKKTVRFPDISVLAYSVWQRNRDSYRRFYKANLLGSLGEPILYLFGMGIGLGAYISSIEGMTFVQYMAPGLIMGTAMHSATFECTFGSYSRMVQQRTFEAILTTPVQVGDLVMGEILWGATKSLISGGSMLLIIILAGLMKGSLLFVFPILLLIFLMGILFSAMAMTVTAISPSYDFFSYYFTLGLAPMFFFSGIFFPLENFPEIVSWLSNLLPLTHAVDLSRSFVLGDVSLISLAAQISFLLTLATFFSFFSIHLVEKRIVR